MITVHQWITRWEARQRPEWRARRRATEQRMRPRKLRDHKAAALLRQRRHDAHAVASQARHIRGVWRDGDDGYRCLDCHTIPLKPWEPVDPDNGWSCPCADGTPEAEGCIYR